MQDLQAMSTEFFGKDASEDKEERLMEAGALMLLMTVAQGSNKSFVYHLIRLFVLFSPLG